MNKIFLLILSVIITSCNGQEKTSTPKVQIASDPSPTVIRKLNPVAMAPDFDTTLVSQYIRSIFQDSKGDLWFGTLGEGVVRYDVKTLTYFSNSDGFVCGSVYAINEDKTGNLWFGTDQGVYKYDGKRFINYNQKNGLDHIDISRKSILVDQVGTIWVGTHGGVYLYNPSADTPDGKCFSIFQQLPAINVTDIMEDKNGNIWFASSENGVYRYDGKTITNITEKEGLGDNCAGGMAQDKDGNMWFIMKNGICKYDGKTFTEYLPEDGLGGSEFWGLCLEESGILWVTARGSTTRFDPSVPISDPKAFTVYTPEDGLNCCVQSMYQDKSGNMWWGAGQGLYRFNGDQFYQVKKVGPW